MNTRLITCLTLTMLALGCADRVRAPIEGRQDPYAPPQVQFASNDLRKQTAVAAPELARDDTGNLLYVTLPIRSAVNKTLYVDYRVTFLDRAGRPVGPASWQTAVLQSNIAQRITSNSTSANAVDFQVDLRWAR
jgi:hypothetical protein